MLCVLPRSTSSHCGSEKALDQRVPVFPSTAFDAGKPEFSSDEAVAGRFRAMFVVPQVAAFACGAAAAAPRSPVSTSVALARMAVIDRGNLMRLPGGRHRWVCMFTCSPYGMGRPCWLTDNTRLISEHNLTVRKQPVKGRR